MATEADGLTASVVNAMHAPHTGAAGCGPGGNLSGHEMTYASDASRIHAHDTGMSTHAPNHTLLSETGMLHDLSNAIFFSQAPAARGKPDANPPSGLRAIRSAEEIARLMMGNGTGQNDVAGLTRSMIPEEPAERDMHESLFAAMIPDTRQLPGAREHQAGADQPTSDVLSYSRIMGLHNSHLSTLTGVREHQAGADQPTRDSLSYSRIMGLHSSHLDNDQRQGGGSDAHAAIASDASKGEDAQSYSRLMGLHTTQASLLLGLQDQSTQISSAPAGDASMDGLSFSHLLGLQTTNTSMMPGLQNQSRDGELGSRQSTPEQSSTQSSVHTSRYVAQRVCKKKKRDGAGGTRFEKPSSTIYFFFWCTWASVHLSSISSQTSVADFHSSLCALLFWRVWRGAYGIHTLGC